MPTTSQHLIDLFTEIVDKLPKGHCIMAKCETLDKPRRSRRGYMPVYLPLCITHLSTGRYRLNIATEDNDVIELKAIPDGSDVIVHIRYLLHDCWQNAFNNYYIEVCRDERAAYLDYPTLEMN